MKNKLHLFIYGLTAALLPSRGMAQDGSSLPGELSANVTITSDYIFRGISQSDEHFAVQGGLDWDSGQGIYLGVWASSVDFNDGDEASVEIDVYGGYGGEIDNFSFDIGFIYYAYPGASDALDYNFWEVGFNLGYDLDVAEVSAGVFYSPDNFGNTGDAVYVTGGISIPLVENLTFDANVGHYTVKPAFGDDYWTWNIGLSYAFEWFDVEVRYHDVDEKFCGAFCDARAVFSISRSF